MIWCYQWTHTSFGIHLWLIYAFMKIYSWKIHCNFTTPKMLMYYYDETAIIVVRTNRKIHEGEYEHQMVSE
jgi:hypothetical protein